MNAQRRCALVAAVFVACASAGKVGGTTNVFHNSLDTAVQPNYSRRREHETLDEGKHVVEQKLIQILFHKDLEYGTSEYDWRIRPSGEPIIINETTGETADPVIVDVNMYLRTVSEVNDVDMEYSAHFTFREFWTDPRLKFPVNFTKIYNVSHVTLTPEDPEIKLWMPDTFFQNEKAGRKHMIDKPNIMLRLYSDGRITYSIRMTLKLSCPMNLMNYPMDTQSCVIDLASYAYTTKDIVYQWKKAKNSNGDPVDPIKIKKGLKESLPSFTLNKFYDDICTSITSTGTYGCLRCVLILKREFSYYLLQLYIPSLMLVVVSWVSFFLDKDSVPARVTLGVTTLLTMTTQASGINAKLPPVSYTKAIDVWIGVCLAFIFGALLEFALVNYAARKDLVHAAQALRRSTMRRAKRRASEKAEAPPQKFDMIAFNGPSDHDGSTTIQTLIPEPSIIVNTPNDHDIEMGVRNRGSNKPTVRLQIDKPDEITQDEHQNVTVRSRRSAVSWFMRRYPDKSKRIDVLARVFFPLTFFIFNIVYWCHYLKAYMAAEPDNLSKE